MNACVYSCACSRLRIIVRIFALRGTERMHVKRTYDSCVTLETVHYCLVHRRNNILRVVIVLFVQIAHNFDLIVT